MCMGLSGYNPLVSREASVLCQLAEFSKCAYPGMRRMEGRRKQGWYVEMIKSCWSKITFSQKPEDLAWLFKAACIQILICLTAPFKKMRCVCKLQSSLSCSHIGGNQSQLSPDTYMSSSARGGEKWHVIVYDWLFMCPVFYITYLRESSQWLLRRC